MTAETLRWVKMVFWFTTARNLNLLFGRFTLFLVFRMSERANQHTPPKTHGSIKEEKAKLSSKEQPTRWNRFFLLFIPTIAFALVGSLTFHLTGWGFQNPPSIGAGVGGIIGMIIGLIARAGKARGAAH